MSRELSRTELVRGEIPIKLKELFGSYANAYKRLQAAGMLPPSAITMAVFARAMRGEPVTPVHVRLITVAWSQWRDKYLGGRDVP